MVRRNHLDIMKCIWIRFKMYFGGQKRCEKNVTCDFLSSVLSFNWRPLVTLERPGENNDCLHMLSLHNDTYLSN